MSNHGKLMELLDEQPVVKDNDISLIQCLCQIFMFYIFATKFYIKF